MAGKQKRKEELKARLRDMGYPDDALEKKTVNELNAMVRMSHDPVYQYDTVMDNTPTLKGPIEILMEIANDTENSASVRTSAAGKVLSTISRKPEGEGKGGTHISLNVLSAVKDQDGNMIIDAGTPKKADEVMDALPAENPDDFPTIQVEDFSDGS